MGNGRSINKITTERMGGLKKIMLSAKFEEMLKLSNEYTVGVHMYNNGYFTLYLPYGPKKYTDNNQGYEKAINDMKKLKLYD